MLYLIGLGLGGAKDISLSGLEAVQQCDSVYLEFYTSILGQWTLAGGEGPQSDGVPVDGSPGGPIQSTLSELSQLYGKPVTLADRYMTESASGQGDSFLQEAQSKNVALLVVGDPLRSVMTLFFPSSFIPIPFSLYLF